MERGISADNKATVHLSQGDDYVCVLSFASNPQIWTAAI